MEIKLAKHSIKHGILNVEYSNFTIIADFTENKRNINNVDIYLNESNVYIRLPNITQVGAFMLISGIESIAKASLEEYVNSINNTMSRITALF